MKKNPADGGRYQKAVKEVKRGANAIAREVEVSYSLPRGSVRVSITKLNKKHRARLVAKAA